VWFEPGDMKYVILNLLRDKPMHGYEVMKALEDAQADREVLDYLRRMGAACFFPIYPNMPHIGVLGYYEVIRSSKSSLV